MHEANYPRPEFLQRIVESYTYFILKKTDNPTLNSYWAKFKVWGYSEHEDIARQYLIF